MEGWRAGGLEGWRAGALQKGHSICNYVWVAIQTLNIIFFSIRESNFLLHKIS